MKPTEQSRINAIVTDATVDKILASTGPRNNGWAISLLNAAMHADPLPKWQERLINELKGGVSYYQKRLVTDVMNEGRVVEAPVRKMGV